MTAPFPEPFEVGYRKRTTTDDGMSMVESWAVAVPIPVYGWSPPAPDEIVRPERTGFVHVLDVYCASSPTTHRDKLVVNGVEYFVEGSPDDYRFGPFGYRPGVRVRLMTVVG